MEYPKINSLFKREKYCEGKQKGEHGALIIGEYSEIEHSAIKHWYVEEKVDGTNIRILWDFLSEGDAPRVKICGRTDKAMIPPHLLEYLQKTFTEEALRNQFYSNPEKKSGGKGILFGEGYGPKIQGCGSNYRNDPGFVLFDVRIHDWWLTRIGVKEIAHSLSVPMCPEIGLMKEEEIIEFVKSKPLSRCSNVPQMMEGIIARSCPIMLLRNNKPIMWKLKCKDFV